MKRFAHLVVAFFFGVGALAACQKAVEAVNAPTPTVVAQKTAVDAAVQALPNPNTDVVPLVKSGAPAAAEAPKKVVPPAKDGVDAKKSGVDAEKAAHAKAAANLKRIACLRGVIDKKADADVALGKITDRGNLRLSKACAGAPAVKAKHAVHKKAASTKSGQAKKVVKPAVPKIEVVAEPAKK